MRRIRSQSRMRRAATLWLLAGGLIVALGAPNAMARDNNVKDLPGYVDGSAFAELADEDASIVHVTLDGALMDMVAGMADQHAPGSGGILKGVKAINAVVIDGASNMGEARKMMKKIAGRLKDDGWERIALVREEDALVVVYVLPGDDVIEGLTVMVSDGKESGELVFANIAGTIDLSKIGNMAHGMGMGIPGLSELPPEIRQQIQKGTKKRSKKSRRGTSDEDDSDDDDF